MISSCIQPLARSLAIGILLASPAVAQEFGPPETEQVNPGDVLLLISTTAEDLKGEEFQRTELLRMVPPPEGGGEAELYTFDSGVEDIFVSLETSSSKLFLGTRATDTIGSRSHCCTRVDGCPIGIFSLDPDEDSEGEIGDSVYTVAENECGLYNGLHTVDDDRLLAIRSEFVPEDPGAAAVVSLYDIATGEGCEIGRFFTDRPFPGITSNGSDTGWTTRNACVDDSAHNCTTDLLEFPLNAGCDQAPVVVASIEGGIGYPGDPVYEDEIVTLSRVSSVSIALITRWWGYSPEGGLGFFEMPQLISEEQWGVVGAAMYRQAGVRGQEFYAFATNCGHFDPQPCSLRSDRFNVETGSNETILEYTDPSEDLTDLQVINAVVSRIQVPEPTGNWSVVCAVITLALRSRRHGWLR